MKMIIIKKTKPRFLYNYKNCLKITNEEINKSLHVQLFRGGKIKAQCIRF